MGSFVKAKVGEMEENKREGRKRRMSKEVVRFFQAVLRNKILTF